MSLALQQSLPARDATDDVTLRDETPRDRDTVDRIATSDLAAQLAASGIPAETIGPLLQLQAAARRREYEVAYPHAHRFVLEQDGLVVGLLVLNAEGGHAHDTLRIVDLAVAPENRRTGIARTALSAICSDADARGSVVSLQVWATNEPALRLYESLGFERTLFGGTLFGGTPFDDTLFDDTLLGRASREPDPAATLATSASGLRLCMVRRAHATRETTVQHTRVLQGGAPHGPAVRG